MRSGTAGYFGELGVRLGSGRLRGVYSSRASAEIILGTEQYRMEGICGRRTLRALAGRGARRAIDGETWRQSDRLDYGTSDWIWPEDAWLGADWIGAPRN